MKLNRSERFSLMGAQAGWAGVGVAVFFGVLGLSLSSRPVVNVPPFPTDILLAALDARRTPARPAYDEDKATTVLPTAGSQNSTDITHVSAPAAYNPVQSSPPYNRNVPPATGSSSDLDFGAFPPLPQSTLKLPQSTLKLPQSTLKLPQSTLYFGAFPPQDTLSWLI
jgi:hypothetical protein